MKDYRIALLIGGCTLFATIAHAASICGDVDLNGKLTSGDALLVLKGAVGQPVALKCPPSGTSGVTVVVPEDSELPAEMAGQYKEAFDCAEDEAGGASSGVNWAHCFRKDDASTWRIWNSNCGWEVGRLEDHHSIPDLKVWARYALTYGGFCNSLPVEQYDTGVFKGGRPLLNTFGEEVAGASVGFD